MIPQCDPSILNANPLFKSLHQQLTGGTILNPDGSTRALEAAEERERREAVEELRERQIQAAKKRILTRLVGQLAYDEGNGLPDEVRDLVLIVALYLQSRDAGGNGNSHGNGNSSDNDDDGEDEIFSLLAPDIDAFLSYIPALTPAITDILAGELAHLKTLANVSTSTTAPATTASPQAPAQSDKSNRRAESGISRESRSSLPQEAARRGAPAQSTTSNTTTKNSNIPSLSTHLSTRLEALRDAQLTKLPAAQREIADTAALVLASHTLIVERTIHILERTKHGAMARAEKAHAEHLAKVAEGVDGKVRIMSRDILSAIYTPETTAALSRYSDHLRDSRFRLEERQQNALRELAAYEGRGAEGGSGGGRSNSRTLPTSATRRKQEDDERGTGTESTADIARKYGALVDDVEAVRLEIERLSAG